jgi:ATP-binding cassette subfamily E protein 1
MTTKIRSAYLDEMFKSDVVRPLMIENIFDRKLTELSGGESQRFWIVYCLGQEAHIYLLDEPSANLDVEMRVIVTKVIKRFIMHNRKVAFVVEHDMSMAISLGSGSGDVNSQAIVVEEIKYDGNDMRRAKVSKPKKFIVGMNEFLKLLNITFHTQTAGTHNRPRINKLNSSKDKEQKSKEKYFD